MVLPRGASHFSTPSGAGSSPHLSEVVVELDPQSAVKDAAVRVEGVRGPRGSGDANGGAEELRCGVILQEIEENHGKTMG